MSEFSFIKTDCPCPKLTCERHGDCDRCETYHYKKGKLPYCKRKKYLIKFQSIVM